MIGESVGIFRKKLDSGNVHGVFCKTSDPAMLEVLGCAGFDYSIIDLEHGPADYAMAQNLIRAAENCGVCPIMRISECSEDAIKHALDIGAAGVQIPHVSTVEAAREAVKAARFAPYGERGVCRYVRAARYGSISGEEYFKRANQAILIAQVEAKEGMENFDAIASVEGIDVLFVGPYDLSQSLGVCGKIEHPMVLEAISGMVEKAKRLGKHMGIYCDTPAQARRWASLGVKYLSTSVDMHIFFNAANQLHKELFEPVQEVRPESPVAPVACCV